MTINLELLKRITPEMIILLEKRYNILRAVKYHQPIGRRLLSERLKIGERIVRSEVDILKGTTTACFRFVRGIPYSRRGSVNAAVCRASA